MTATKPTRKFQKPFPGEQVIPIKAVCNLTDVFVEPPSYQKVVRWARHGCNGVRLESHAEGRQKFTSIEAVHRFLERGNKRGGE